jgi:serine/threonine protein kinase
MSTSALTKSIACAPPPSDNCGGEYDDPASTNVAERETDRTVHIGKYTLLETIGEGAFGKVRIAVDDTLGRNFAVRILDKARIEKEDSTIQVRREINIMRAIRHRKSTNNRSWAPLLPPCFAATAIFHVSNIEPALRVDP